MYRYETIFPQGTARIIDKFSPQAWGCTAVDHQCRCSVFPTGVGVYRALIIDKRAVFPTGVGVYRLMIASVAEYGLFSPQAWGCTANGWRSVNRRYFPHRRGGVPSARGRTVSVFPHRRGGVPLGCRYPFSPQAWGCTACYCMFDCHFRKRFPHRRGGVPCGLQASIADDTVGVYIIASFPHRRGGVPYGRIQFSPQAWGCHVIPFSPQAWGCTVDLLGDYGWGFTGWP